MTGARFTYHASDLAGLELFGPDLTATAELELVEPAPDLMPALQHLFLIAVARELRAKVWSWRAWRITAPPHKPRRTRPRPAAEGSR